jgi:hypothetical protein
MGNNGTQIVNKVYDNDGASFTEHSAGISSLNFSSADFGDYDNDGRTDIIVTGFYGDNGHTLLFTNDGDGTFTQNSNIFQGVHSGDAKWFDYDSDGYLDVVLSGTNEGVNYSMVYHNNGDGTFSDIAAGLTPLTNSSIDVGDYDSDGDPDIAIIGTDGTDHYALIYRNDAGVFTDISAGLTGVSSGALMWGDFDADGDLDLVVSGTDGTNALTFIYTNNGNDNFSHSFIVLPNVYNSCLSWIDYDDDNDLDLFLSGFTGTEQYTALLRNDIKSSNTIPEPPQNLDVVVGINTATFSWDAGSDTQTPEEGLSYNLRIGRVEDGVSTMSPMADLNDGFRKVLKYGNAQQQLEKQLYRLPGGDYYWSVQTIDNSYEGSEFATAGSFTITDYQTIELSQGWSLISTYIDPFDTNLESVCTDIEDNLLMIKNVGGDLYFPSLGIDNIVDWNIEEAYKIYMQGADDLVFEGIKIRPEEITLSLSAQWNWIPYLRDTEMSVVTAMEDIVDNILLIKDNSGSMYFPSLNINTLSVLTPGLGYMIYLYEESDLTYPENESYPKPILNIGNKEQYKSDLLSVDFSNTGNDAALILSVDAADNTEIAVFNSNGKVIGCGKVANSLTYITLWGDNSITDVHDGAVDNEMLEIKMFDEKLNSFRDISLNNIEELTTQLKTNTIYYKSNSVFYAEVNDKERNDVSEISLSPNPSKGNISVNYYLESPGNVVIEVYNMNGVQVYSQDISYQSSGIHTQEIVIANISDGIYQLVIRAGEKIMTDKIVIVK